MKIYKKLTDEMRDKIYEEYQKGNNSYKVAYMFGVSQSTVSRVIRTAEVMKNGDENQQKEFTGTFYYVPSTWDWAQRRFASQKEEPCASYPQVNSKLEEDMTVTEIRELKNMLERHLTAVNTALTTILECWGVDSNERK